MTRTMTITDDGEETEYDWSPTSVSADRWSDTLGLTPMGDFIYTGGTGEPYSGDQYFSGGGGLRGRQELDINGDPDPGTEEYFHGDLVGSTSRLTDSAGAMTGPAVRYTAFGEVIQPPTGSPPNGVGGPLPSQYPRYGYVGEYGYESDMIRLDGATGTRPILLSHVGARWYDPAIGRFVQRDPIGLRGGNNSYSYASANPTTLIDPAGLTSLAAGEHSQDPITNGIANAINGVLGETTLANASDELLTTCAVAGGVAGGLGLTYGVAAHLPATTVQVTRWGSSVGPGSWVMLGGPTLMNYLASGKAQPGLSNQFASFSNSHVAYVCSSTLKWPWHDPFWWIKGPLGQRIFQWP